jgi:hypothetical protein
MKLVPNLCVLTDAISMLILVGICNRQLCCLHHPLHTVELLALEGLLIYRNRSTSQAPMFRESVETVSEFAIVILPEGLSQVLKHDSVHCHEVQMVEHL